jgi:hypothetical protein
MGIGHFLLEWAGKDNSSVSLKSRIRAAQSEATKGLKRETGRHARNKSVLALISLKKPIEEEIKEVVPTVEEIRTALLRKSANGKNTR